LVQAVRH
jgi:hypothetical protein